MPNVLNAVSFGDGDVMVFGNVLCTWLCYVALQTDCCIVVILDDGHRAILSFFCFVSFTY